VLLTPRTDGGGAQWSGTNFFFLPVLAWAIFMCCRWLATGKMKCLVSQKKKKKNPRQKLSAGFYASNSR
jgi:hypothetical protein